uniref:Uncharacterized protein n=1 Tax=Utricularia reniformis TaxID=192314 RepID=A0A1Y0B1K1_9LAMI|nr:hypothetical protein AEK19_MT1102 [Utricularia reniformis]ART31322.1 hypothetical protein AEK19_MT1102 [Utricularia reniformis]
MFVTSETRFIENRLHSKIPSFPLLRTTLLGKNCTTELSS